MSKTSHHRLINGVGLCSVPMWYYPGIPAGQCDKPAYGERPEPAYYWRDGWTWELRRSDGKYDGYIPGLACPAHGGPTLKELAHKGDPCDPVIDDRRNMKSKQQLDFEKALTRITELEKEARENLREVSRLNKELADMKAQRDEALGLNGDPEEIAKRAAIVEYYEKP